MREWRVTARVMVRAEARRKVESWRERPITSSKILNTGSCSR